jgi:hypothetical protein
MNTNLYQMDNFASGTYRFYPIRDMMNAVLHRMKSSFNYCFDWIILYQPDQTLNADWHR